uniref:Uncharacterized protein n=1 Tax=Populus trichocarpa TaxID=3694 RepID=A0A2K2C7Z6_POPTR
MAAEAGVAVEERARCFVRKRAKLASQPRSPDTSSDSPRVVHVSKDRFDTATTLPPRRQYLTRSKAAATPAFGRSRMWIFWPCMWLLRLASSSLIEISLAWALWESDPPGYVALWVACPYWMLFLDCGCASLALGYLSPHGGWFGLLVFMLFCWFSCCCVGFSTGLMLLVAFAAGLSTQCSGS